MRSQYVCIVWKSIVKGQMSVTWKCSPVDPFEIALSSLMRPMDLHINYVLIEKIRSPIYKEMTSVRAAAAITQD